MSAFKDGDAEPALDSTVDQRDTKMPALSFSQALRLTRELAFGILAVLGCVAVQCLIVSWILVSIVQINFVLLQARLLCAVYHGTFEKLPSVETKKAAPTESRRAPSSLHSPILKPSTEDGRKDVTQVQLDEVPAPDIDRPEASLVTEAPTWQTKVLSSRKAGHGRSYAVKQIDVPMSSGSEMPGSEPSRVIKRADISMPQDFDTQASITTGSLAARRSVPTIPPGFGTQRSATGDASLVQTPASVFHDILNPKATSFEPEDDVETLKAADHLNSSDATTEVSSVQTPTSVFNDSLNPKAASFEPDDHTETFEVADQLFSSTRIAINLPSGGSRSTTRSARHPKAEARQISAAIEHNASLCNNERLTKPADVVPRNRIARSSAIKKVQPAQHLQVESTHPTDQAVTVPPITRAISRVVPAITDKVTTRVEVSPLTDRFSDACPETPLTAIVSPLDPEEAAREALKTASRERESFRKKLTTGYSQERALEFAGKARTYKDRRQDLAACMPWGELSIADEKSFPYLSTKDTTEPQTDDAVTTATEESAQRSLLPSPPSSSENAFPLQPRADPAPFITKASMAYQVLLKFTKNMEKECSACNSRFCHEGYTGTSKQKLKSARDLYLKTRSNLLDAYDGGELPEEVAKKLPDIIEC